MPKGNIFGMDAISNMNRGENPSEKINYEAIIDCFEEIFERGYMEELLEKYYLKNTHRISVIMLPDDKAMNRKRSSEKICPR